MTSLRPASVCDTTPLKRFESSSSDEPSSPGSGSILQLPTVTISIPVTNLSTTTTTTTTTATLTPTLNLSTVQQNNNNNHKIELNLPHFISDHTVAHKMEAKGILQILRRILLDLCMLSCVGLPLLSFGLWGEPHHRGFFCKDETLKHPYKESTIKSWMLYTVCVLLPVALIIIIEFYKSHDKQLKNYTNYSSTGYYFCSLALPDWLIESYKKIGILIFGCGVQQLTTDIAKYSLGRLRPHFFAVCQPVMFNGTTCSDRINENRFIENYTCLGVDASSKMLKDINLSFPSGHASFTFYTMLYIVIYLQCRMDWKQTKMVKHLLQFLFLMFAWYTSLTRISDYKHHYTDVIAGAGIGMSYAAIVTSTLW